VESRILYARYSFLFKKVYLYTWVYNHESFELLQSSILWSHLWLARHHNAKLKKCCFYRVSATTDWLLVVSMLVVYQALGYTIGQYPKFPFSNLKYNIMNNNWTRYTKLHNYRKCITRLNKIPIFILNILDYEENMNSQNIINNLKLKNVLLTSNYMII